MSAEMRVEIHPVLVVPCLVSVIRYMKNVMVYSDKII